VGVWFPPGCQFAAVFPRWPYLQDRAPANPVREFMPLAALTSRLAALYPHAPGSPAFRRLGMA